MSALLIFALLALLAWFGWWAATDRPRWPDPGASLATLNPFRRSR